MPNGVVAGENYRVLSVDKIYHNKTGEETKLLRLKSTTGVHRHTNGVGDVLENNGASKLGRGEFWMPYQNW